MNESPESPARQARLWISSYETDASNPSVAGAWPKTSLGMPWHPDLIGSPNPWFRTTRFIATESDSTPSNRLDSIDRYGSRGPKQPHRPALWIGPTGPVVFATDPSPPHPRPNRPWAIAPYRSIFGRALVWNTTAGFGQGFQKGSARATLARSDRFASKLR
jgi:hypothetical protein